jgi:hypothetical protein
MPNKWIAGEGLALLSGPETILDQYLMKMMTNIIGRNNFDN